MWIRIEALLCCMLATTLATNEHRSKKKNDLRAKRTLDYSISHNHNPYTNFRSERRIVTGFPNVQLPQYPLFYPVQQPFTVIKKLRPNAVAPPYAVQMEPVVHYSPRDPLYDASLSALGVGTNELKVRDQSNEHTHHSRATYAYPPEKHVVERPVYIKEPEPIIEIIIKESNITLPPLPTPPVTVAPRKKEQVQVFYVKYKKNPNAYGKDSIVYDKPIPALTPHVAEETEVAPQPLPAYEALNTATLPPPPSTTLRAIVKPESETYHADKGIHITFGKTVNEQRKRSNADGKADSSAEDATSQGRSPHFHPHPQARQINPFPSQPLYQNKPQGNVHFENTHSPHFKPENQRFHNDFRHAPPSTSFKQPHFSRDFLQGPPIHSNQQPTRPSPPNFSNQQFQPSNSARQPVPYQPFDQIRQQQPQVQFPRTHTHFPVNQQSQQPQYNNGFQFNQQAQNYQRPQELNSQYTHIPAFQPLPNRPQQINQNAQHLSHQQQSHVSQQQQSHISQQQQQSHIPQQQITHNQISVHNVAQAQHIPQPQFSQQHTQQRNPIQQHNQQTSVGLQSQQHHNFPANQPYFAQHNQVSQQHPAQSEPNSQLLHSVPKYEQHISVNVPSQNHQKPLSPQPQPQNQIAQPQTQIAQQPQQQAFNFNQNQQYSHLIQQQLKQNSNIESPQLEKSAYFQQVSYQTSPKPISTTQTPTSTATSTTTTEGRLTENDLKDLNIQLPDEVPDDLREQLLSSGILRNAQISVLDYDKVGDTSIADLPPDQLANFFSAGGAQLGAASENVPVVVKKEQESINNERVDTDMNESESALSEVKVPAPVEMKIVRYDPQSKDGQQIPESYIEEGATQVDPVSLEDQQYTRYLPVKVNGAAFPIPDVPELKGRSISSVVVLAPVDLNVQESQIQRKARDVSPAKSGRYLAGEALKTLIDNPTTANFQDWLDKENKTAAEKQAVVLLVTGNPEQNSEEKEIFMYDLATQTVSKLSGELSSAFVDAAETNSQQNFSSSLQSAPSNVVETRVPYPHDQVESQDRPLTDEDLEEGASEYNEAKIPLIDPAESDSLSEASEQLERFVDISGMPVQEDLVAAASTDVKQISA